MVNLSIDQMRARSGPVYEHYTRRRFLGAHRRLLELEAKGLDVRSAGA